MRTLTLFKVKGQGKRVRILASLNFFRLFRNCKSCVYNCDYHLSFNNIVFKCVTMFQVILCRAML